MKSNKKKFEEISSSEIKEKISFSNYNSKNSTQALGKKNIAMAYKNPTFSKSEIKESQLKSEQNKNINPNVLYFH